MPNITFTAPITVNGPMFDIHDNKEVHIHTNASKSESQKGASGQEDLISQETNSVLQLLDELVNDAISNGKSAKHILMPVRAAQEADVLPIADLAWVNTRYDLELNPTNWSDWVNKKDANYDDRELNPLITRFQALKTTENKGATLQTPL